MHKIIYLLFRLTSYVYIKKKYPEAKKLKFNGYFINIFGNGKLKCGEGSYISYFTRIYIEDGTELAIGNDVSIGHNVRIYTSKVSTGDLIHKGIKIIVPGDVKIGNNVLITANVYVGPGVEICSNVVIGANSVVTKSITEPGVYSGSPARRILS